MKDLVQPDADLGDTHCDHPVSVWMPIETAPKDGIEIDVWVVTPGQHATGRRVTNAFWETAAAPWIGGRWSHRTNYSNGEPIAVETIYTYGAEKVTHWLPIPAAPRTEETQ